MENENTFIIKREYPDRKKSDVINVPVKFRQGFLSHKFSPDIVDAPISAMRIIFKVLNDISFDQFQKNIKQIKQYSLFENDFKTENNTYARFTFKVSQIADKDDYTNIKKGLEFLENFQKKWHSSPNEKGKKISSYGGFISNPNISDGKISFLISSFWLEKISLLTGYNPAFTGIAWKFSKTKHLLFYLWLLEISLDGTNPNLNTFNAFFGCNYTNANVFAKNVLKSIKKTLDLYSNLSFNYSVKGQNISIVPYSTKTTALNIKPITSKNQEITQRLSYWQKRHKIDKSDIYAIRYLVKLDYKTLQLLNNAYTNIVKKYRTEKVTITELQGKEFLTVFQDEVKNVFLQTTWGRIQKNGFPKFYNPDIPLP